MRPQLVTATSDLDPVYLWAKQGLGIIVSWHEDFHNGYEAPESVLLVQIEQGNSCQPEEVSCNTNELLQVMKKEKETEKTQNPSCTC